MLPFLHCFHKEELTFPSKPFSVSEDQFFLNIYSFKDFVVGGYCKYQTFFWCSLAGKQIINEVLKFDKMNVIGVGNTLRALLK